MTRVLSHTYTHTHTHVADCNQPHINHTCGWL